MKKICITLIALCTLSAVYAQKIMYLDTEYMLNKIPAYKEAQKQLDNLTKQWQTEIEEQTNALNAMYKQYQVDKVLLSNDMRAKREQDILDKETEVRELQKKRFGPDGDRFKKEQELIKPIQDELYNAVKETAIAQNYNFVFDAATSTIIYSDVKLDVSDAVLKKMGYIK
ncbi:MAG: OmpH family outer membrane protein [Bacteroidales bacterium]|jgi:outer membrane protein|nr:OmpH family outer membrane protein [Bacteroidales bacterium]